MKYFWKKSYTGTVAINMYSIRGPWGGSNVFVQQFAKILKRHGYRVQFDLKGNVDLILLIDPRKDLEHKAFGVNDIIEYKRKNPDVKVLHRINECDKRKNSDFMDDLLEQANDIADHTVFISEWLREYFIEKWFDSSLPHHVIYNGADPSVFHPVGGSNLIPGDPVRVVTHHWSYNPMKGFPLYTQFDNMITEGKVDNVEFWVIGQWPKDINWRSAKTFPPAFGAELAELLRKCHLYLTASLWEPCGMHHVEGAQCGLPLLYHADTGGIVEAGEKYGLEFRDNLAEVLTMARDNYLELREKLFERSPNGDLMCLEYMRVAHRLLA